MPSQQNPDTSADRSAKDLQPAAGVSRFVDAGGLRLHYLDYGTAGRPPMLCVHGGAAHAHWFDYIASGFTADYHVLALDLRGHGDSEWTDPPAYSYADFASEVAAVAEKLDLRDFVLIGHSMGGMVSLTYAATHPGRVGKLVIIDTTMRLPQERIAAMRDIGTREGRGYATQEEHVKHFRLRPGSTTAAPEVVRHMARSGGRQFPDGTWRHKFDRNVYGTREDLNGMPYWSDIRIPALLVKGDRSPRITPEVFAQVKARCPQVELAEVTHSDHHVTLDNPAGFVSAVRAFLS